MYIPSPASRPSTLSTTLAVVLGTVVAVGLLNAVAVLFQVDGTPMVQLAAAERACAQLAYVSERQACMRELLDAAHASTVASK